MRFMLLLKSDAWTEAGTPPTPEVIAAMSRYNEAMAKAGVFAFAEGLMPRSAGALIRSKKGGAVTVENGPFAAPEDVVASRDGVHLGVPLPGT